MDEPCDWDVCTEASTPSSLPQLVSRSEKKRRDKVKTPSSADAPIRDRATEHSEPTKPEKTCPTPRRGGHGDGTTRKGSPPPPNQEVQTRKQLQDALPKIPPLSSFKSPRSRFMTFEEAEQDFESFITTGLGRTVEVIREFRGREEVGPSDQNEHRESVTLYDDGAQILTQTRVGCTAKCSPPRSASESSSQSDMEEEQQQDNETVGSSNHTRGGEYRAVMQSQTDARNTPTVSNLKSNPKAYPTSAPKIYHQTTGASNGRDLSQPESYDPTPGAHSNRETNQAAPAQTGGNESRKMKEEIRKRSKKLSEKMDRERKRDRDQQEQDEEEEEGEEERSAEIYWRACYRAWNDYYASMSPFQEQGYQSYYSVAHNWMAAYRMNAVYMEELLKH